MRYSLDLTINFPRLHVHEDIRFPMIFSRYQLVEGLGYRMNQEALLRWRTPLDEIPDGVYVQDGYVFPIKDHEIVWIRPEHLVSLKTA